MRSTVTFDPDTEALSRRRTREQGVSLNRAVNDAIRAGLGDRRHAGLFRTRTVSMGTPTVNLDRALQVAAEMEDIELARKGPVGE